MTDLCACLVNDGEGVLGPGAAVPDVRQPHTLPHNSHHIQLQLIFLLSSLRNLANDQSISVVDPKSDAFFTPGSGIVFFRFPDPNLNF